MAGPDSTSNLHWNWPWVTRCHAVSFTTQPWVTRCPVSFTTQPPQRQQESINHIWTENIWFSVLPLRASVSPFLNEDKHIHPTRKRETAIHILFAFPNPPEHQMRPAAWKSIHPRCFSQTSTRPAFLPLNPMATFFASLRTHSLFSASQSVAQGPPASESPGSFPGGVLSKTSLGSMPTF